MVTLTRSEYLATAWLRHLLGHEVFTPPTLWIGLYIPAWVDSSDEVSGGQYSRQVVTFGDPISESPHRNATNDVLVTFTNMPAVTVGWAGLHDADTGEDYLYYAEITPNAVIEAGQTIVFFPGSLTIVTDP